MKNLKKAFAIMIFVILSMQYTQSAKALNKIKLNNKHVPESVAPLSKEEVLQAFIGDITQKFTVKPLRDHYGMDLPYQIEFVKVIDAKMIYGVNNVEFVFKTQIQPFVGAHNPVGTDELTFRISDSGIKLEKYEHIESFPVPSYLKKYYKNLKSNY